MQQFGVSSLDSIGLTDDMPSQIKAAGALIYYLGETQKIALPHINRIEILSSGDTMPLPENTRRNLEITEGIRSRGVKGSLIWVLDKTLTAMGARLLRSWVEQPLLKKDAIVERLEAVGEIKDDIILQQEAAEILKQVYDMERLLSRISFNTFNARDCLSLLRSLNQIKPMREILSRAQSGGLKKAMELLVPADDLINLIHTAIDEDAPISITEGGIIKKGYSASLDELRSAPFEGRQWLVDLESAEKENRH